MKEKSLEHQIYMSQIFSITLTILLSIGVFLHYNLESKQKDLDINMLNTGILLSESPEVEQMLNSGSISQKFEERLDRILKQLDYVDVLTICNSESIRLYHSNKSLIGKPFVGGDQTAILNGSAPYIINGKGTLGDQRRAFFPVIDESHKTIGFVMVSVLNTSITQLTHKIVGLFILPSILLILAGILTARMIYRRLKKILLGYRPEDFRKIHIERKEVLDALEEGIFAINSKDELILINESAKKILQLDKFPEYGTKLTDIYPETRLPNILKTSVPEYNINTMIKGQNILSNRIPIVEDGVVIGAVCIFRNKTEVTKLAEELTGARYMVDTLRAFNHEFKNKLHVILGYIQMGQPEKVNSYILNTGLISSQAVSDVTKKIQVPGIAALLIGKIIRANELGIQLRLKQDSSCKEEQLNLPSDIYITILGNLIENSIEELNHENINIKEIEIGIHIWQTGSILSVDDTGRGIPMDLQKKIYEHGFSTKGEGRGSGMYLIRNLVERYHGTIEMESEEEVGTSFVITFSEEGAHV